MFELAPTLQEVVECARRNYRCGGNDEMTLRGRVDCCRGGRPHYALVNLSSESYWVKYKQFVDKTNVISLEVVIDINRRPVSNVCAREDIPLGATQESIISHITCGRSVEEDIGIGELPNNRIDMVPPHMDDHLIAFANDDFPNDAFETDEEERDDDDLS
ncbi:hypothetical protein HU200_043053 [Digitaria exilis]|uniref:Uncharacterized protein n=1 Tax=Digitaria exilis TaxID=1010633 RepID=A0A835EHW6_9POAL|nr:hypothetical protein HU200_043053 [Digitaria exilis]